MAVSFSASLTILLLLLLLLFLKDFCRVLGAKRSCISISDADIKDSSCSLSPESVGGNIASESWRSSGASLVVLIERDWGFISNSRWSQSLSA